MTKNGKPKRTRAIANDSRERMVSTKSNSPYLFLIPLNYVYQI